MSAEQETLRVAEQVRSVLEAHGLPCVLIGALALARHGYVRATVDVDLAVCAPLPVLRKLVTVFRGMGLEANFSEPDGEDPLGGVLNVRAASSDPIQVINFEDRFPVLVKEALARGERDEETEPRVHVADLGTLILFKLYAGGRKSELDILELLDRHPELDLFELRHRARQVHLDEALERVLSHR